MRRNIVRRINQETYWDIAVARPAPRMPISSFIMNRASRKMFRIPPEVSPIIAKNARPSYLRILFITQLETSAGAAQRMHIA